MQRSFTRGALAALAAVVLWGLQFPVAKDALAVLDAFSLSTIRYLVATLLLGAWLAITTGAQAFRTYGRFWPAAVLGVIGMTGSPLLVFMGLALSRPENVAIIVALQPSITALADWLVRRRRPANFTLACIAFAFAGVVTVVTKGTYRMAMGHDELVGDGLVIAGILCWVVYTMGTQAFREWSALKFTIITMAAGTAGLILATAIAIGAGHASLPSPAAIAGVSGSLAFLAIGGVLVSMILWNWGNQTIGAVNAMLALNLLPVVTFAYRFAQGQRFAAAEIAGVAMVIGALVANNLYLRRTRLPADGLAH